MKHHNPPVTKTPYVKEETENKPSLNDGAMWVCEACGKDKLGIVKGQELFVKYRERNLVAQGLIRVVCRFCHFENLLDLRAIDISVNLVLSNDLVLEPGNDLDIKTFDVEPFPEEEKPPQKPARKKGGRKIKKQ